MNVPTKFEVRSLTVPEIIGGTQKIRAAAGYAHTPFSPSFFMGCYSEWLCKPTEWAKKSMQAIIKYPT